MNLKCSYCFSQNPKLKCPCIIGSPYCSESCQKKDYYTHSFMCTAVPNHSQLHKTPFDPKNHDQKQIGWKIADYYGTTKVPGTGAGFGAIHQFFTALAVQKLAQNLEAILRSDSNYSVFESQNSPNVDIRQYLVIALWKYAKFKKYNQSPLYNDILRNIELVAGGVKENSSIMDEILKRFCYDQDYIIKAFKDANTNQYGQLDYSKVIESIISMTISVDNIVKNTKEIFNLFRFLRVKMKKKLNKSANPTIHPSNTLNTIQVVTINDKIDYTKFPNMRNFNNENEVDEYLTSPDRLIGGIVWNDLPSGLEEGYSDEVINQDGNDVRKRIYFQVELGDYDTMETAGKIIKGTLSQSKSFDFNTYFPNSLKFMYRVPVGDLTGAFISGYMKYEEDLSWKNIFEKELIDSIKKFSRTGLRRNSIPGMFFRGVMENTVNNVLGTDKEIELLYKMHGAPSTQYKHSMGFTYESKEGIKHEQLVKDALQKIKEIFWKYYTTSLLSFDLYQLGHLIHMVEDSFSPSHIYRPLKRFFKDIINNSTEEHYSTKTYKTMRNENMVMDIDTDTGVGAGASDDDDDDTQMKDENNWDIFDFIKNRLNLEVGDLVFPIEKILSYPLQDKDGHGRLEDFYSVFKNRTGKTNQDKYIFVTDVDGKRIVVPNPDAISYKEFMFGVHAVFMIFKYFLLDMTELVFNNEYFNINYINTNNEIPDDIVKRFTKNSNQHVDLLFYSIYNTTLMRMDQEIIRVSDYSGPDEEMEFELRQKKSIKKESRPGIISRTIIKPEIITNAIVNTYNQKKKRKRQDEEKAEKIREMDRFDKTSETGERPPKRQRLLIQNSRIPPTNNLYNQ